MENRNRFLLPLLIFIFAYLLGFTAKWVTTTPVAQPLAEPLQSYLELKYLGRFQAARSIFGSVFSIFLLNALTYSINLWLGPFCVWLIHLSKQDPPMPLVISFTKRITAFLGAKTSFGPDELLFYYLAPLTLVFFLGFDGGLFQRPQVFLHPYAWVEFFVAFFSAAIGLSLVEFPFKKALCHYLALTPYLFIAAIMEAALI